MYTSGPYRQGNGYSIVSDHPVDGCPGGGDDIDYYGGHLIAESVSPCNSPLLIAAPDLLAACNAMLAAKKAITDYDASIPDDCYYDPHHVQRLLRVEERAKLQMQAAVAKAVPQ